MIVQTMAYLWLNLGIWLIYLIHYKQKPRRARGVPQGCSQEGTRGPGLLMVIWHITQSLIVSGEVVWTVYSLFPELTSFRHVTFFVNIKWTSPGWQNLKMSSCWGGTVCTARVKGFVGLLGLVVNLLLTVLIFFFLLTLLFLSFGSN